MAEFNWHISDESTRSHGVWMSAIDGNPTCYIYFAKTSRDYLDTQSRDGLYLIAVCKSGTFITYDDPNYENRLLYEVVGMGTFDRACEYVAKWCAENIEVTA